MSNSDQFIKNLEKFQLATQLSRVDIIELSQLNESKYNQLAKGQAPLKDIYQFCINLGIDYRSIYSDLEFSELELYGQYESYPREMKRAISGILIKKLAKKVKGKDVLKDILSENLKENILLGSRLVSGTSYFTSYNLKSIRKSFNKFLSPEEFDYLVAVEMYSHIINYNYNLTRKYFNLTYQDIADKLNLTSSTTSNWGGLLYTKIPLEYHAELASFLGGFTVEEFRTQILQTKDMNRRGCSLSLGNKLIDPPPYDSSFEKDDLKSNVKSMEDISTTVCLPSEKENLKANQTDASINDFVNDRDAMKERALKMFNALSEKEQDQIMWEIGELFFAKL